MKWDGKPGAPCTLCGMDRSTDYGLCFDCAISATANQDKATWQEIIKLEMRIAELQSCFKHTHVNNENQYDDRCKQCGLDLRDKIHIRI